MNRPLLDAGARRGGGTPGDAPRHPRQSLRRAVAWAFVPLVAVVVTTAACQFLLARAIHHDVRRLFEELREVALARSLVDELRGIEQWVAAAPRATPAHHGPEYADVRQHLAAATATQRRFAVGNDPSTRTHAESEARLLRAIDDGLRGLHDALEHGSSLGDLAATLAATMHAAATMAATIESESRAIGDELDRGSDDMTQFLVLLGLASVVTIGALGLWLLRRVLQPVHTLRSAAVRLGHGDLDAAIPHHHDDEIGDLAATLATMADRLRRSRLELETRVEERTREVLRSARLAQIGTLAAGIAHEINNPLASIVAGSEGLLRELDRKHGGVDAGARDYLQILHKEALRARDITARLLRFAHQDAPRREPVHLANEAREVAALFAHQVQTAGVRLEVTGSPGTPPILGDPAEWRQVLFNLLRNALDASPRGGTIRVDIGTGDGGVQLAVADEGPGVPLAQQDRIFEPFFTTKEPGKGTGLGLAIVHRIVDSHGGRIVVGNGERGARFTITVPAAPRPS